MNRFKALEIIANRRDIEFSYTRKNPNDSFKKNVYHENPDIENIGRYANQLKNWAIDRGANHYTHWFNPLTGENAEKHDSFLTINDIGKFTGKELMQQEPDASSFPTGGIRSTFEARGYTAWDPSSPPFIIDDTLCIPSTFISYEGHPLDYKTPLLRSSKRLSEAVNAVLHLNDKPNKPIKDFDVKAMLGWEQEYFLVDEALYNARPDLILARRTLFGHASARDQQLSDHYFGVIPERRLNFMKELEDEAHKLGIPLKTRHNEVAPNQFECAPIHEEVNLSVDHNQLLMYLIEKIAKRHNLVALLHEKPFKGINGSGKHCNWSIEANSENLLNPNKKTFILFLVNILVALNNHSDLLRACIAHAGNDLRLGGHEAPPAIISAFIGNKLTEILDKLEKGETIEEEKQMMLSTEFSSIFKDNTDRNRTSPFAFTGNKFEFRAVGSSTNCAPAMIVLNTIVADQLFKFSEIVREKIDSVDGDLVIADKSKELDYDAIINETIRELIPDTKKIRFEGNNYSDEWLKEAQERGLKNITNTPDALEAYTSEKTIELLSLIKY